jgi:hypothetical protein
MMSKLSVLTYRVGHTLEPQILDHTDEGYGQLLLPFLYIYVYIYSKLGISIMLNYLVFLPLLVASSRPSYVSMRAASIRQPRSSEGCVWP